MKKGWILAAVVVFTACDNKASVKINTDTVGTRFEEKANKLWDTTKENLKETGRDIKEKVKEGLDNVEINISRDTSGTKN